MASSVAYNLLILGADAALLAIVVRQRERSPLLALGCALGVIMVVLAGMLGEGFFGVLRQACFAVFAHVPLVAIGLAIVHPGRGVRAPALAIALVVLAIAVDAFLIEPQALEVTRFSVSSSKLERSLRVVVVSDLQTDHVGDYERRVLEWTMAEKPDLILLPGDYIQGPAHEMPRLRELLREVGVSAPLGVHAVGGNVDAEGWPEIFTGIKAVVYAETRTTLQPELAITGLSLDDSFDASLRVEPRDRFHIVMGHAPDFALGNVAADLLVAGHTHGGQVRLPWLGPLITLSRVPRAWSAGKTELSGGRQLVVSRGIGLERGAAPRLRFLCRPELVVIDVVPAQPVPSKS
jgi:uncharacterized protein